MALTPPWVIMISLVQLFREHIGCTCSMICQMHAAFTVYSFSQSCFICSSHHWYFAQSADQVYTLSDGKSAYPTGLYARCQSAHISDCVHCIDIKGNSVTLLVGIWEIQLLTSAIKLSASWNTFWYWFAMRSVLSHWLIGSGVIMLALGRFHYSY